jgi:hypothetical protein
MRWLRKTSELYRVLLVTSFVFLLAVALIGARLPAHPTSNSPFWSADKVPGPCAIALYGLPRSFRSLVLPSLIQNVIQPNAVHRCDYFVYFHDNPLDPGGRDDRSGKVQVEDVYLLRKAIQQHHTPPYPTVIFGNFTNAEFWEARGSLLQTIHLARDDQGRPIYLPYKHASYGNASIENVVKMWHAQEAVWRLLDDTPSRPHYSRVAMLRLDVVYLTPIRIYQLPDGRIDVNNSVAVIPNFARHPVNDRLIFGPYDAVQVWAAQRISRLRQHGRYINRYAPGDGIHSERYLNATIFPVIRQRGIDIVTHPELCFLRARADGSVRFTDCGLRHLTEHNRLAAQSVLGRHCRQNLTHILRNVVLLECQTDNLEDQPDGIPPGRVAWHPGCFIDEKYPPKKKPKPCLPPHISFYLRNKSVNNLSVTGLPL